MGMPWSREREREDPAAFPVTTNRSAVSQILDLCQSLPGPTMTVVCPKAEANGMIFNSRRLKESRWRMKGRSRGEEEDEE
jgi:hypothetical protein